MSPPRPDLQAHAEAVRLQVPELVAQLQDLIGSQLVAYLAGVRETRAVRQWAAGERTIGNAETVERLRTAYIIARLLATRDSAGVVQAWFQGLNPLLDDESPARVLREQDADDAGRRVLAAARQFAAVG